MRPLRVLVRDRLKLLGRTQQWLAGELGIESSNLSSVLTGTRTPPLDKAAEWAAKLDLVGEEAVELENAMHLAASTERVRVMVDQLERDLQAATQLLSRYRERTGAVRYILDFIEPDGAAPPLPTDLLVVQMRELATQLLQMIAAGNAVVHSMPITEMRPSMPPAPAPAPAPTEN